MSYSSGSFARDFFKPALLAAVKIAVGILFLVAGIAKLAGAPELVAEFAQIGFGQWFRYLTAVIEITGAVLLLWPGLTVYGAMLLLGIDVGALLAQLFVLHGDFIHPLVLGAVAAGLIWINRNKIIAIIK